MTSKKQSDKGLSNPALYVVLALFATIPMGLLGAFLGYIDDDTSLFTGFAWGIGIAIALLIVMGIGMFGWEWIKKEAAEGKLRPFMLSGLIVAIAISGWFAWGLGDPTCIESTDPDGRPTTCLEYADDGFEVTSGQRWEEFWSKLPATLLICLLIAYIAHGQSEKNRPKKFNSKVDRFSVGIFPENISVNLDDDGNSYKYRPYDDIQYGIEVIPLEDFPTDRNEVSKIVEEWHRKIVSAATKVRGEDVEYNNGEKEHSPYLYSCYTLKKGLAYCQLTLSKNERIYYLTLHLHTSKNDNKRDIDRVFFEFVDSFRFTR